ncbi:MAG: conjugal transfer protein TraF [Elusimicrobiota bacterium]|nr:conjugal transfer protein TraF [Elusimicrobiota bacterium]
MKSPLFFLAALMLAAAPASALEWHPLGARAVGMGGAGVASTKGPLAAYWNPGALGRPSQNGLAIPLGVHAAVTGSVIEGANNLKNLNERGTLPTQPEVDDALNKFDQPGSGLRVDGGFGADLKIGRFAFFLNGFTNIGAVPQVDRTATPGTIQNGTNNSKLIIKGANIAELGAAYGRELPFAPGLHLGGALKLMNAQVGHAEYFVLRNDNSQNDIVDKLKDGAAKSTSFGVDAGALWDLDRSFDGMTLKPRVGIVGRNLNNPKFDRPAAAAAAGLPGRFAVNPQVRMGVSITPLSWWNLAADLDLTRNLTPVDNAASRQFGLGSEFNVFNRSWLNIPLRVGLMRNTAETSAGNALTLGAGLNFLHVTLEASAAVSGKRVTTESQGEERKMPREVAVGFQLSFLFGGSEEEPAAPKREWKAAPPADAQPASTETIRKAAERAQEDLEVEELQRTPAATP